MSITHQKTATCRCGKKIDLARNGTFTHGCGRIVVVNYGKVEEIRDKVKKK